MSVPTKKEPGVLQLSPREIKAMLDRGELELFDVRTEEELQLVSLAEAQPLDMVQLLLLDRSRPVAFLCHRGVRSLSAAKLAMKQGFVTVYNVKGGIDAWSVEVDPSLKRY